MNKADRLDYIFGTKGGENRFAWLKGGLIGDIQLFVNAIVKGPPGGNLAIPILASTGLELAAALYTGRTDYLTGSKHAVAEDDVAKFITECFPHGNAQLIPHVMWDSIRNGIGHLFSPKSVKYSGYTVDFMFYVERRSKLSHIEIDRKTKHIQMKINSIEYFQILEKAVSKYERKLRAREDLQNNFIDAWKSIETHSTDADTDQKKGREVQQLISAFGTSDTINLF